MMQNRQRYAVRFVLPRAQQPMLLLRSYDTFDHLVKAEEPKALLYLVCRLTVWLGLPFDKNKRGTIAQDFGAVIRDLRQSRALSQERLAEAAGLHRTYIGFIERGERNVTIETAQKLAAALGTSLSDLFYKVEHHASPNAYATREESKNCASPSVVFQFTFVQMAVTDTAQLLCLSHDGIVGIPYSTNLFMTSMLSEGMLLCLGYSENVILLYSG